MEFITLLGFTAGALNTVSYLPQVIRIWKMKETRDISLVEYLMLTTGTALWVIYGALLSQPPIWVANGTALALILSIDFLKIKYG